MARIEVPTLSPTDVFVGIGYDVGIVYWYFVWPFNYR